jgi:hypothetical protein
MVALPARVKEVRSMATDGFWSALKMLMTAPS